MTTRTRIAAIVAASSILLMAFGFFYLKGGSTAVDVNEAVDRYRSTTQLDEAATNAKVMQATKVQAAPADKATATSSRSPTHAGTPALHGRPLPKEGVYVYATTGGDDISVLGGSKHTYPSRTTVTVRHTGCGLSERWDALSERWDERQTCRSADGDKLKGFTSYHEFYRHADKRTYACTGYAYPAGAKPGDTWSGRCVSGQSIADQVGRAIAWETLTVGGVKVKTLHIRVDSKLSGEQVGTSTHEVWGDFLYGIAIRERSTTSSDSVQPVFGKAHYHEAYELMLTSLQPRN